jgi:hypothetical protein
MRPREKTGGKASKTQRPKTVKRRNTPNSVAPDEVTDVARLTRERDEARSSSRRPPPRLLKVISLFEDASPRVTAKCHQFLIGSPIDIPSKTIVISRTDVDSESDPTIPDITCLAVTNNGRRSNALPNRLPSTKKPEATPPSDLWDLISTRPTRRAWTSPVFTQCVGLCALVPNIAMDRTPAPKVLLVYKLSIPVNPKKDQADETRRVLREM